MANQLDEKFRIYEEGKLRRYNLLFAVNGGAFAVARLFGQPQTATLLGNLTLPHLSAGMIAFTGIMALDILKFGEGMRKREPTDVEVFKTEGKCVLIVIALLLVLGWGLVGFPDRGTADTGKRKPPMALLCSNCSIPEGKPGSHVILLDRTTGEVWAYKDLDQEPVPLGKLKEFDVPRKR